MSAIDESTAAGPMEVLRRAADAPIPPALGRLVTAFELGRFETRLVMLAFGLEIDPEVAAAIAQLTGRDELYGVPLALAHRVLGEESWVSISPSAPLRRWQILHHVAPAPRSLLQVRLADNVTDALLGLVGLDRDLDPYFAAVGGETPVRSTRDLTEFAELLAMRGADGLSPVLVGQWPGGLDAVAALARAVGLRPYQVNVARLASSGDRLPDLKRLWERDLALMPTLPIFEQSIDPTASAASAEFCTELASHVVILGDGVPHGLRRDFRRVRPRPDTSTETVGRWREALGTRALAQLNGSVERAAAHFTLAPAEIAVTAAEVRPAIEGATDAATAEALFWSACGRATWPAPGPLATVVQPQAVWSDLVVPAGVQQDLLAIVRQVQHSATVFQDWGFGRAARGRGLLALFAGPSGTGKTLAAEVISAQLRLPLVKADFSQLQSKWVGETPKLVGRLFDQLEAGGAVLLIDEADGLIGRRGSVGEAHDRYANVEVGYFLQRLEDFRGLAILTTNLKNAIDEAFLRRFRFVIDFALPGVAERSAIWDRVFPEQAPRQILDVDRLARLPLSGGAIHNVALNAAFLAADAEKAIGSEHVITALRAEYRKMARSESEIDIGLAI